MGYPEQVAKLLLEKGAVELRPGEPFRFASGILSPIYCDNRLLLSEVSGRNIILDAMGDVIQKMKVEQIAGVATAGIAWGAWVAERFQLPFVYVRSSAKEHGKKNMVEGKVQKVSTVLIEDLVSTGGSVLQAVDEITEAGAIVSGVCAIFSYGFKEAMEAFKKRSVQLHTLTNLEALLQSAQSLKKITEKEEGEILEWQKNPREWAKKN